MKFYCQLFKVVRKETSEALSDKEFLLLIADEPHLIKEYLSEYSASPWVSGTKPVTDIRKIDSRICKHECPKNIYIIILSEFVEEFEDWISPSSKNLFKEVEIQNS